MKICIEGRLLAALSDAVVAEALILNIRNSVIEIIPSFGLLQIGRVEVLRTICRNPDTAVWILASQTK
jgi:hypothetical protein